MLFELVAFKISSLILLAILFILEGSITEMHLQIQILIEVLNFKVLGSKKMSS